MCVNNVFAKLAVHVTLKKFRDKVMFQTSNYDAIACLINPI